MNIKRAFLAAVAVFVMVPGLAMAQSSSTFPGSFTFDPLGPEGVEFDLTRPVEPPPAPWGHD